MKRALWIIWLIVCTDCLQAQTASFNFSRGANAVTGWTNAVGDPVASVISVTDPTGITISSIATANWAPFTDGHCSFDNGGAAGGTFFPAAVMLDQWFQFGTGSIYNSSKPQLSVTGLTPGVIYSIKMTGSFAGGNVPGTVNLNPMNYTVTGAALYGPISVNGNFNTSGGAIFTNVSSDASGSLKIFCNSVSPANTASLSGLQIITGNITSGWQGANGILSDSTDNIAIGTTDTKGYKLAVNGNAIFTKITVKPVNLWPDYVFDKGYRLPAIPELEQYIHQYKHLPGIMPAAEVESKGIELGENQSLILKKLEELTLYIIIQNKDIGQLKRQNKLLEKKIAEMEGSHKTQK